MVKRTVLLRAALAIALAGCAGVAKERGHQDVARIVSDRSGQNTGWEQGSVTEDKLNEHLTKLLASGLTKKAAIEIALMNNPELQVTYEELDVSQAEMIQGGMLSNPKLGGSIGWTRTGSPIEYEVSLVYDFLELFVLPMRKKVADAQFEVDTLRVAHQALEVTAEVKKEYVHLQAQTQSYEMQKLLTRAAESAAELAQRQHKAGNINELMLATEQATWQQALLQLRREEVALNESREKLNRLLGLHGPHLNWQLAEKLEELPANDPALKDLEATAVKQRLDIDAARKRALLMENAITVAKTSRVLGLVEVGIHTHQDPDGPRLFGPTLDLELPLFDQRQALIAKLEAEHRAAQRRVRALQISATSEVRVGQLQLSVARQAVDVYRKSLLPLRERIVEQAQLQYNAMQIGLYELLTAKQAQIDAQRGYLDSVRDYWVARAELERLLGSSVGQRQKQ